MNDRLTALEMETLEFARGRWAYAGVKDAQIRERFGISRTRYEARLNALLDRPAALVYDPELVRRLTTIRDTRRAARNARTSMYRSAHQ